MPTMLRYATHAKNNSLYNTPPTFAVYMLNLVLRWIEQSGGLAAMARAQRAARPKSLYDAIDSSGGFYRGHAEPASRSQMNVTFRLPTEAARKRSSPRRGGRHGRPGRASLGRRHPRVDLQRDADEGCAALAAFMG